jgi:hypothetical protein
MLVVVSVMLAAAATEAGLRTVSGRLFPEIPIKPDPDLGWSLKPGIRSYSDENTIWVEHNSAGFRDRERAVQAAPGTLRVAVIGDSFVHGYFAALDKMFGAFLEQELNQCAARPSRSIEVLSFGVFGYNTTQELLTYQLHAAQYRPDIVVLATIPRGEGICRTRTRSCRRTAARSRC